MIGEYYINNGNIYDAIPYEEDDSEEYKNQFKLVQFKPFNIFDLQSDVAIKFDIESHDGFLNYVNFEILHDNKYIIYRNGDSEEVKEEIKLFLTSNLETIPETLIESK